MADCPTCSRHLHHIHRQRIERLIFADVFRCPSCGIVVRRPYRPFRAVMSNAAWVFALHTSCIRCGRTDVRRSPRDRIDRESWNLLSRIQGWTGAPLYRCGLCRVTYHDWRPSSAGAAAKTDS